MTDPRAQASSGAALTLEALSEPALWLDFAGRVAATNGAWREAYGDFEDERAHGAPSSPFVGSKLGFSDLDREALDKAWKSIRSGDDQPVELLILGEVLGEALTLRVEFTATGKGQTLVRFFDLERGTPALDHWRRSWVPDLIGVGAWEYDLRSDELWWSDEVYRIHQMDESVPMTVEKAVGFYAPEGRPVIEAALKDGIENGTPWDVYLPIITAKGRRIWVQAIGRPQMFDGEAVRLYGVFRDVTEEHTAELRLQESEERLNLLIKGSNDGYWDWVLGTETVWYSPRYLELLGFEPREVEPTLALFSDNIHPEDSKRVWAAINNHLRHDKPYSEEFRLRHRNGDYRWVWARGQAIRDESGEPVRMTGILTDVTDLYEARQALERAREYAEECSREKSAFLANMSHEIRTPMTAILGFADLLPSPTLTDEERGSHIETIRRNGEHLLTILNDILDLSKIEAGRMEVERIATSPLEVVEDVKSLMMARATTKGLELEVGIDGKVPGTIGTDPVRLRQILNNLVGNAIKFTAEGSVRIQLAFDPSSSQLTFDVVDTGIGVEPDNVERLFNPFTQSDVSTTRRFGGSGLGLTISKRLAETLGGDITVTSEPGRGSTFRLTAPVTAEEAATLVDGSSSPSRPARTEAAPTLARDLDGVEILLAEDGVDNQRLLTLLLRRGGANVTIANNGREAVELAQAPDAAFDLVLMDMQMPELDGYGATSRLRQLGSKLPIIALTAHAMSGDHRRCLAAGCDDYLTKPVDPVKLLQTCSKFTNEDPGRRAG